MLAFSSSARIKQRDHGIADSFLLAIVYRPSGPYSIFMDEFSEFAADVVTYSDNILLMGNFNIHVNNPSDSPAKAFLLSIDTFGFKQHVQQPTHTGGNTLDLVLTRGVEITELCVSPILQLSPITVCSRSRWWYVARGTTARLPITTIAMADKLPCYLHLLLTSGVLWLASRMGLTPAYPQIDSLAPLVVKKRKDQRRGSTMTPAPLKRLQKT